MADQVLPAVPVDDLRARLDADPVLVPDEALQPYLRQAERVVGSELADEDYTAHDNVAEAIAQIAVKLWDMRARGLSGPDLTGDFPSVVLPATAGMVRSVYGLLLPSMPTGGISV